MHKSERRSTLTTRKNQIPAIVLFLKSIEEVESLIHYIDLVMKKMFPEVDYVEVCIENGDNINQLLREYNPKIFIFDADIDYQKNGKKYPARELMGGLCMRYKDSQGLLMTEENVGRTEYDHLCTGRNCSINKKIIWFTKLRGKECSGLLSIEKVLKQTFG